MVKEQPSPCPPVGLQPIAPDRSLYCSTGVPELGALPRHSPVFAEHAHSRTELQVGENDHPAPGQRSRLPAGSPCRRSSQR